MNLYETVKGQVTPQMAAERYGLPVNRSGMACCPFHDDRTPSMKLYPDHFHCFGCGPTGDVIDLTAHRRRAACGGLRHPLADRGICATTSRKRNTVPSDTAVPRNGAAVFFCADGLSAPASGLEGAVCAKDP